MSLDKSSIPSDFVDPKDKLKPEYMKAYAEGAYQNFINYYAWGENNREQFIENRRYAEGLQSIEKYKSDLGYEANDLSYVNLDYSPVNIISKYVNLLVGEISNQDYKITCNAIDPISRSTKDKQRALYYANMKMKPFLEAYGKETGQNDILQNEFVPESEEELDLHMQMTFKQDVEVTVEEITDYVLMENDWERSKRKVFKDFVDLKKGGCKVCVDENDNIIVRPIDPVNLVHSYSEQDDFSDLTYCGELKQMTIGQIRREAGKDLSDEDLFQIAKKYSTSDSQGWNLFNTFYDYYNSESYRYYEYDNFLIPVLDLEFISIDTDYYEKKYKDNGGFFINKKSFGYSAPPKSRKKREVFTKDVANVYKVMWVLDTDYVFSYGMKNDMVRTRKKGVYSADAHLSYILFAPDKYEMQNKSLVEKMIPHEDAINIAQLKIQQLVRKATPPGYAVDISALQDVTLGRGKAINPPELVDIFLQTGFFFHNSRDEDGIAMNRRPIEATHASIAGELQEYMAVIDMHKQHIMDITGIDPTRSAIGPDKDASVTGQQMSMMSSRNATRSITDAYLNVFKRVAAEVAMLSQDLISQGRLENWDNVVGSQSINTVKAMDGLSLAELGIIIEALPDEEEKALIEQNIQQSLAQGELRVEDAIMIRSIYKTNTKHANQYLILRRKQYDKEKQEASQADIQAALQQQTANAQAKMQADTAVIQAQLQADKELLILKSQLENNNASEEHVRELERIREELKGKENHIRVKSDEDFKLNALNQSSSPSS